MLDNRLQLNLPTLKTYLSVVITLCLVKGMNQPLENPFNIFLGTNYFELSESVRIRRSLFPTEEPLYCPPCEQVHCSHQNLNCKGNRTWGICGCCRVCAKVEGEQCGGQHDYLGKCDSGLFCEPQKPSVIAFEKNGVKKMYRVDRGLCKKEHPKQWPTLCKPKCNPEFCKKYPRGICSAAENEEKSQQCQGVCQHTSCRACRFVLPEEECPKCENSDFKCIRNFGRCVRKKTCRSKSYPCGNTKLKRISRGIFQCQIPECEVQMEKMS